MERSARGGEMKSHEEARVKTLQGSGYSLKESFSTDRQ